MYVRYRLTLGGVKRDTWETRSRYSDQCQKLFDVDRLYWTPRGHRREKRGMGCSSRLVAGLAMKLKQLAGA